MKFKKKTLIEEFKEMEEKKLINPLKNKKIKIALITRQQGSLHKNPEDSTLAIGGKKSFVCPDNKITGIFQDPLTTEERLYLEDLTGNDFSVHNATNNFYASKQAKIILHKTGRKNSSATIELDLSDPYQFIRYKIALINPRVANSWAERNDNRQYEFVIIDGEVEQKEELDHSKLAKEVSRYLLKNENSKRKLYDLLRMYGVENVSASINYKKVTTEFIYNELYKATLRKSEISKLYNLIKIGEKDISDKIFIQDAITIGLLEKRGREYRLSGGDKIGNNELEAIAWFTDKLNQNTKLRFEQEIEEYYSEK